MWRKNLNTLNKVFVGLSGGVDSAISAALLKSQGFDVTGVFIKVWQPDFLPCGWRDERRDAMKVCLALNMPFLFFDFETEYKKGVIDKMITEYKTGRTPNPDVLCNKEIKFGAFWQKAKAMGADFIATGHYARIEGGKLKEGRDKEKDQSYFLWTLAPNDLSHILFPVGNLKKSAVRTLARRYRLSIARKKDSQGLCFIGDVRMDEFLFHFIPTKSGDVLNTRGEIVGAHRGAVLYTIGERHGFEILKKKPGGDAFYVLSKDMAANTLTVSNQEPEIISLSPRKISVSNVNWINSAEALPPPYCLAQIRYRGEKIPVTAKSVKSLAFDKLEVEFKKPVRGLSLGQSIVFYDKEVCLGGGVMDKILE